MQDIPILQKILSLVEAQHAHMLSSASQRIYNNKEVMALLGIKDRYLKRHGDKYWYTQSGINAFFARCHYAAFADKH